MQSVREKIMQQIQTTLQTITVSNGYATTLNAVERLQQSGQSHQPPMAVLVEGDDRPLSESLQDAGGVALQRELEMGIVLELVQDEAEDARSASEAMNELLADVQRAMEADVSRGSLALNTEEIGIDPVLAIEGKSKLVCVIGYRITYRHRRIDPRVEV